MEGMRERGERSLVRRHEPGRLQEEVWVAAYEQIRPQRRITRAAAQPAQEPASPERHVAQGA
jgi:hypothetical protein